MALFSSIIPPEGNLLYFSREKQDIVDDIILGIIVNQRETESLVFINRLALYIIFGKFPI